MTRKCGACQVCCKLLPVRELSKPANTRCKHQRHGKGCMIYGKAPMSCALWNCRWLVNDAGETSRPDHAGYAIDIMPDFLTLDQEDGQTNVPAIQIWADPARPLAYRDPALYAYLASQWEERQALGLVRFDSKAALVLIPPAWSGAKHWIEQGGVPAGREHSFREVAQVLSSR